MDHSFAQVENDEIQIESKELQTENNTNLIIEKNSTNLQNNIKSENLSQPHKTDVTKIIDTLEEIKNNINQHDTVSSYLGYLGVIIGGIFGIYGIQLTLQERKSAKIRKAEEETNKKKINDLIKSSIGRLYENIKDLPEPTSRPYDERYKRLWALLLEDSKIVNTVASSSPYIDESLRHNIIGYTMFLEKQINKIQTDQKIRQRTIVGVTKRIIDNYFPEHYSEHQAWLEHQEEEVERNRLQQEEEYAAWYEEQKDSGLFDEDDI